MKPTEKCPRWKEIQENKNKNDEDCDYYCQYNAEDTDGYNEIKCLLGCSKEQRGILMLPIDTKVEVVKPGSIFNGMIGIVIAEGEFEGNTVLIQGRGKIFLEDKEMKEV